MSRRDRNKFLILLVGFLAVSPLPASAGAGDAVWRTDYEAARRDALEQDKPLYILFTGPGWCALCECLEEEVLSDPRGKDVLSSAFIPVRLESLRQKRQPRLLTLQYKRLARRFEVEGVPTVLVVEPRHESVLLRHAALDLAADEYVNTVLKPWTPGGSPPPPADPSRGASQARKEKTR